MLIDISGEALLKIFVRILNGIVIEINKAMNNVRPKKSKD